MLVELKFLYAPTDISRLTAFPAPTLLKDKVTGSKFKVTHTQQFYSLVFIGGTSHVYKGICRNIACNSETLKAS